MVLSAQDLAEVRRRIASFRRSLRAMPQLASLASAKAFELYSLVLAAQALQRRGYQIRVVNPIGSPRVFVFKSSTQKFSPPNNYSYLIARNGVNNYEIRSNQWLAVEGRFGFLLDTAIIQHDSIMGNSVRSNSLISFFECKDSRWSSELLGEIVGVASMSQPGRTFARGAGSFPIPAVLLITYDGSNAVPDAQNKLVRAGMSIRLYCSVRPSRQAVINDFLLNWF